MSQLNDCVYSALVLTYWETVMAPYWADIMTPFWAITMDTEVP